MKIGLKSICLAVVPTAVFCAIVLHGPPCDAQGWGRPYWNRNFVPYQTRPPYPGAVPLYYDGNIPVFDYTEGVGTYGSNVYGMNKANLDLRNRAPLRPRPAPVRRTRDFGNDDRSDKVMPRPMAVIPPVLENPANAVPATPEGTAPRTVPSQPIPVSAVKPALRTWKTKSGGMFEDARIIGMIDGQLGLQTPDGRRHYVAPEEFDGESRKAFDEWRLLRKR